MVTRARTPLHGSVFCRLSRTRLTGYKKKLLGVPSEKGSGDVPRARFTNIFFSEIIAPLVVVGATLIPYLFINSRTMFSNKTEYAPNAILRIAIVAFAPIGVNAGVAGMFFAMACCMGPIFSMCCKKFGSVLAAIAHAIAVIVLMVIFIALFVLESFSWARTISGVIAAMAIQRFIYKLIISLALTREFKHDQSNIAWWTGKWYNMGWHSMSQPGREFLCKITELGYFAADFILGHVILFFMLPVLAIPYADKFHSVILFWLRPRYVLFCVPRSSVSSLTSFSSRQIRPPIYSLKQSKLRKRRVVRFAILYFVMLVVFVVLIAAPLVIRDMSSISYSIRHSLWNMLGVKGSGGLGLLQPLDAGLNDTATYYTGSHLPAGYKSPRESVTPTAGDGNFHKMI